MGFIQSNFLKTLFTSGAKRYFKNTSWLLGEKVLRMGAALFVGIWVARYLGPEQYGSLNYAIAFVALFNPIVTLGLDEIVVRELVKFPNERDEILGTAFLLKATASVATWCLVATVAFLLPPDNPVGFWIILIIAGGFIFQSFDVLEFYFRAQVLSKYTALVRGSTLIIVSLLKVVLIIGQASMISFAVVGVLELFLVAVGFLVAYRLGHKIKQLRFKIKYAQSLLKDSWPAIFSGLSVMLYMRSDQIMLGQMVGDEAVGLYSAATRISEAWYFIPMVVVQSLFPAIINAKRDNTDSYYKRLQLLFSVLVFIAYAISIPMTFFSDELMVLLYGKMYEPASQVLMIHIWTGVFVSLGVASGSWYVAENLVLLSFYRTLLGCIVNIILNVFLIPHYGIIGAAVASLIAQVFAALMFDVVNRVTRRLFYMKLKSLLLIHTR